MNEGLKKVLETLGKDEEFAKKMGQSSSPSEAFELAKTVADGFTLEEFQDVMTKLDQGVKAGNGEISEEDLKKVAGGMTDGEIITVAGSSAGAAVIVSVAAAAAAY